MEQSPRHQCLIYAGLPSEKLPALATTMLRMMGNGYRCLYMNSVAMVEAMKSCLISMGVDVAFHLAEAHLLLSSEAVSTGEDFDIDRMLQKLEAELDQALKDGYKGLWASGDMTWELGSYKNFDKLVEYEWKLEALFQNRKELHGICQYHQDTLPVEAMRTGLLSHRTVFINDTLSRVNPHYINSALSSGNAAVNALLDKMIAELCRSNSEMPRK